MRKKPQIWHLNASWGEHDLTQVFLAQGFWELDAARHSHFNQGMLKQIKEGDIVFLVSFSGIACITTKASGVVTRVIHKQRRLYIMWNEKGLIQRGYHNNHTQPIYGPFAIKTNPEVTINKTKDTWSQVSFLE